HLIFSDDGGAHWRLGATADPGTNESQVVELGDGRLMMNMRNHPPKTENFRMVAFSDDGGGTLSPAEPDRALIEPPAHASLMTWQASPDGRRLLLFANPASTVRERMTVRISEDSGRSWATSRRIYDGPSAYASLAALPNGDVGLLYERGARSPYERIAFARFSLEWI